MVMSNPISIEQAKSEQSLHQPFGVRLDPSDHRDLLNLARQQKTHRNRLIKQAVKMLLAESQNVEPPAA